MIRHFVMLRFRGDVTPATKLAVYQDLSGLRDHLDGILDFHAGPNVSIEHHLIKGFGDAFLFDFADEAARDTYVADARHKAVGSRMVEHLEGGAEGVVVFDMKL